MKQQVNHGDLAVNLAQKLRESLASGEFPVGGKLPSNRDLAERFGVSQVTARMATLKLAGEGLLEIRRNCGTYVRTSSAAGLPSCGNVAKRVAVVLSPWDSENEMAYDHKTHLADLFRVVSLLECQLSIFSYKRWLHYYQENRPLDMFLENRIDTVIWFHSSARELATMLELQRRGYRQLILNRRVRGLKIPAIMSDYPGLAADIVKTHQNCDWEDLYLIVGCMGYEVVQPMMDGVAILENEMLRRNVNSSEHLLLLQGANPDGTFCSWAKEALRTILVQRRPKILIDFCGYLNVLSGFPESFYEGIGRPDFISCLPPSGWNCPKNFHYTCYSMETAKISRYIRQFLENSSWDETVYLPFIKKNI